jgi:hypothetical protein
MIPSRLVESLLQTITNLLKLPTDEREQTLTGGSQTRVTSLFALWEEGEM